MGRAACMCGLLAILLPGMGAPAAVPLAPGTGAFEFTLPRSGQSIMVHYVLPDSYDPADPPVLVFHGMLRNADEYRDAWIGLAREHGLFVVAPAFDNDQFPGTEAYNLGNLFASETDLTRKPESGWTYPVPGELFDHLRQRGATTAAGYLAFGHSAGSQFLHRKLALFPDPRLRLVIAANAGWYTFPDLAIQWPYGLGGTGFSEADFPALLAARLVVLLGNADIDPSHDSLRRTPEAMRQGDYRLQRGETFFAAGKAAAAQRGLPFAWRLQIVDGAAHENEAMAPAAARLMADFIQANRPGAPAAKERQP